MTTINATLPVNGFDGIRAGQIFERRLFGAAELTALVKIWRIRPGKIQDRGRHFGVEVLQFVEKRTPAPPAPAAAVTTPATTSTDYSQFDQDRMLSNRNDGPEGW